MSGANAGFVRRIGEGLEHYPRATLHWPEFRRAAVLVPLLCADDGIELLFTVRSVNLASHAGQISFPGGRLEPSESDNDAARRETFEEVGLSVPTASLLGYLDDQPSPARYVVTPVVGALPWPQPLVLEPAEVDEVFTVPLNDLLAMTPRTEERWLKASKRTLYFYDWGDRIIWGMTGNILKNLLDLIKREVSVQTLQH
ncbi:MAG: CoA pyrophosphatase [Trueperaceae bacterium]|nr:CoA pyrophosphatase [Trueperaceae bacterium]